MTANNGAGYCVAEAECSSTFKVAAATKLEVFCPTDPDLPACTSAADIQKAYDAWIAGFSVEGGCSPTSNIADIPKLPADFACAGANLSFTLTANNGTGYCVAEAECSSTFKVAAATKLEVFCPTDPNLPACTSAADIQKAYDAWIAGFSVKGGCSPTSNIADIPKLPADFACAGADLSFTLTANNKEGYCVAEAECSSTFKVAAATKLEVSCPTDPNLPACTSAADILKAYDTWVAGFSVKGGCSPTSNIADIPKLPADFACKGADLSFLLIADNGTGYCVAHSKCSSTFKVAAATTLVVTCPPPVILSACNTVDIQAAYDSWKAGFKSSGDCNLKTNIDQFPPLVYETDGSVNLTFTYIVEGDCDKRQCNSTFYVPPCGGHIFPTQTTCCNYLTGTSSELKTVCYIYSITEQQLTVTNVRPGVFFYFTKITAPSSNAPTVDFTIAVNQTPTLFKRFEVQLGKDIKLYDRNCNRLPSAIPSLSGTILNVTGATPGAEYVLAVKYDTKSIIGSTYSGTAAPTPEYKFITSVNGVPIPESEGSIKATPDCKDYTPLPLPCVMETSCH